MATKKPKQSRSVVSIANGVYEKAKELSKLASQHGWQVFGVDRDDPPTIGAMFDEGIKLLAARLKKGRGDK